MYRLFNGSLEAYTVKLEEVLHSSNMMNLLVLKDSISLNMNFKLKFKNN